MRTYQNKGLIPWILRGMLAVGFFILMARLAELQIIKGAYYLDLAEGNRIRRVPISAPRGEIHARGGEIIAGNKSILKKLKFDTKQGFEKVLETGISPDSEDVVIEWEREYKLADAFAHSSGYIGEVNEQELGTVNPGCVDKGVRKIGSLIGRSGLEEYYECDLVGIPGEDLFEIDSRGQFVRRLGRRPPISGENIVTNIDYDLQSKVASVLNGKKAAVVITDTNGEVLAIHSSPTFNPNYFVGKPNSTEIAKLLKNIDKPFFNRAIGGLFHPGSVFKPIVALAALEEHAIDRNFTYQDIGQIVVKTGVGDFTYNNWFFTQSGGTEGNIGLARALARSTDTFFYKMGEHLGVDKIAEWSNKFGLTGPSNIDLPGEVAGLVPTQEWKKEVRGESWFLGNTYHYSIGQGDLAVTPLSINMATNAVLNGRLCKPKIVGESECHDIIVDKANADLVKKGMIDACSPTGTANVFFEWNAEEPRKYGGVVCKTGTAETGVNDNTHAWFVVMAPVEGESQIVMTVLVEEGGEGSQVAAPIAKEILEYWFSR